MGCGHILGTVSQIPKNLSISLLSHQTQGKDCAKAKVLLVLSASQPGRGWARCPRPPPSRDLSPPCPCPTGEIQQRGSPVLASPLINSHNYQPGQALPLIVALQCFARQLLNQQEQPPRRAETPARGEGWGAAGHGGTLCGTRGCCAPTPTGTEGVFCQAHPISWKRPSDLTEPGQDRKTEKEPLGARQLPSLQRYSP